MRGRLPAISILLAVFAISFACGAEAADPNKVLRFAQPNINGLDPHQNDDGYSQTITDAIFESLYEWDYLSRPTKLVPLAAETPPEITHGGTMWTVRVKPGIFFTDHPAFEGKPRELVAQDFVYSIKRRMDPNLRLGGLALTTDTILGARPLVDAARKQGARFDYDASMEGLRALDRYTVQFLLTEPNYPVMEFVLKIVAVAREVVEAAGAGVDARPVGSGPYRLRGWKRGSRIILEANPKYRAISFPTSADPMYAELIRSQQHKALPQIGIVDVSLIEEELPMLLEFERGNLDYVVFDSDVANRLLSDGKLRREYQARGLKHYVYPRPRINYTYFNLDDPILGGFSKEHVALRRAIAVGFDTESVAKVVYGGQALPANQLLPPGIAGHDPKLPTRSLYDPATAQALLDRFGYGKRDQQGYRLAPDGQPLTLTLLTRPDSDMRAAETLWKKNMDAIGLRMQFREVPFQDMMKESIAGKYQVFFGMSWGGWPSGWITLNQLYGKQLPAVNRSRFKLAEYDQLFEQLLRSEGSAERVSLSRKMSDLALAYAPMIPAVFRLENVFAQSRLKGFYPSPFATYWKYLDIDIAQSQAKK